MKNINAYGDSPTKSYRSTKHMYDERPETNYYYHWDGEMWHLVVEQGKVLIRLPTTIRAIES